MDWLETLSKVAPTVATALGGPLAGAAISAISAIIGGESTPEAVQKAIESGRLTPDQITRLKELELKYKNEEAERGFKYEELAYKDRDSARQANVQGGTQKYLFWLSILLLIASVGCEIVVLFNGLPHGASELVVGRVLGLMDAIAMLVLSYWYGTSNGSAMKNEMLKK